jgi:hypothetical protein
MVFELIIPGILRDYLLNPDLYKLLLIRVLYNNKEAYK